MRSLLILIIFITQSILFAQNKTTELDLELNQIINNELKSDSVKLNMISEIIVKNDISLKYLLELCDKNIKKGQIKKLNFLTDSIIKTFPNSWKAWQKAGLIYSMMGMKFNKALTSLQKAIELYPNKKENLLAYRLVDAIINKNEISNNLEGKSGTISSKSGKYLENDLPDNTPLIFGKNIISTKGVFELCVNFSPDLNAIVYSNDANILISHKRDGFWTYPKALKIPLEGYFFEPSFSPDGKYFFFNKGPEIWCAEINNNKLSNYKFLTRGMFSSLSKYGNLYFTDLASGDIHKGIFKNGKLTNITKPKADFNSVFGDAHPTIHPDEKFIIFDSSRPGGKGWSDYYVCFRNEDGSWGKAKNIKELNTLSNDICATLTPDSKYILINKDKDVYWISSEILNKYKN